MIHIVDYGMGNLRSVQKAFEKLGFEAVIARHQSEVAAAKRLVLPGVGAFRDAIAELKRQDLTGPVCTHIAAGRPFLGICLGLQMLMDVSYEDGEYEGLKIIRGKVVRFENRPGLKVPHMGWNQLEIAKPSAILEGVPAGASFYFVHSYFVQPDDASVIATRTEYGVPFVSSIARGNLFATQFHPEKSQRVGMKLLENFARLPAVPV